MKHYLKWALIPLVIVTIPLSLKAQFILNTGVELTNGTTLSTNGVWQNSGQLTNNGKIITSEKWTNTGTLSGNGGFVLIYDVDRNFIPGSNPATLGFIEKDGVGTATLDGKLYVRDSLKLLGGLINLNTDMDTLGFFTNALQIITPGSYVQGPMAAVGPGTVFFPIGLSDDYLPIRFINSTSSRVGVNLNTGIAGYSAGDAVSSVIDFPYIWQTTKASASDTASAVEIQVPTSLLGFDDPIIVRKAGNETVYEGMGSRQVTPVGGNTSIRSYSRGLQGQFTLAVGYAGDMLSDSTELVNLYNATNGNSWTTRTNWKVVNAEVPTWFGITEKGGRVIAINLQNNNVTGEVPSTIVNLAALKSLDVSDNKITSIPDLTVIPALATLDVSSNNLDFESLEANASLIGDVVYENQDSVGNYLYQEIPVSSEVVLNIPVGGTTNQYQWLFKGQPISGATSDTYTIPAINRSTMGDYILQVTNPQVPGLTLLSNVQRVLATANIEGTLFANTNEPATTGRISLFRIQAVGGYDTIRVQPIQNNGNFLLENVILDDYTLLGYADTLVHQNALPTWFEKSFLWEEADTLFLNDNIEGLNIVSVLKPTDPLTGPGELIGTLEEELPSGRTKVRGRVSSAGVAVRRVERAGRPLDDELILVAYVFTNENGEFFIRGLDQGNYRLNIQYPGYPMDETSFIQFTVGSSIKETKLNVEALVDQNKIRVRQLIITGYEGDSDFELNVFPNPVSDKVTLAFGKPSSTRLIQIHDSNGRAFTILPAKEPDVTVDVREWPAGLYIIRVQENNKTHKTIKLLIQD